jgi:hypothetical protein
MTVGRCLEVNFEWLLFTGGPYSDVVSSTGLTVYDKLRHRYTIIVLYCIMNLLYDRTYTTSRSFDPHDIRYDTNLCECRVAGVYYQPLNVITFHASHLLNKDYFIKIAS